MTDEQKAAAFKELLRACEQDFGEPSAIDADDEAVGGGTEGDMCVTFGHLRRARRALGLPVVEYDPDFMV